MVKLVALLALVLTIGYLALVDDDAMSKCEVSHSHDTCLYSLSR